MSKSDGSSADYYVLPEDAKQLQDLISHRDMNSQIGEIFRACYRYGIVSHSDKMRDAKKIRFYAQAEVERLEKLSAAHNTGGSIPANATYIVGEAASEQCGQLEEQEAHTGYKDEAPLDIKEWSEWKSGDVIESLESVCGITKGGRYVLSADPDDRGNIVFDDNSGNERLRDAEQYIFIHRPTSTTK